MEWLLAVLLVQPEDFDNNYDRWISEAEDLGIQDILDARAEVYAEVKGE
ncbi:MAG: hypothetical protein ACLTS6_11055 [Anaerobutyricum sp.]